QRVRRRQEWARLLMLLNEEGLRRLAREWEALPPRAASRDLQDHPYGGDLDLFGRPALAQLLGPTGTPAASATLERWLLEPANLDDVAARQHAVRELSPLNDLRDRMAGHARRAGTVRPDELKPFLAWAEEPPLMTGRTAWRIASWLLPVCTFTLIALDVGDVAPSRLWLLPLLAGAALTFGPAGATIRNTFRRAFAREEMFRGYPELMKTITHARFESPLLLRVQTELRADGVPASEQMRKLQRIMHLADLRYSPMLYLPVQLLTLWDFHVMARVDHWRRAAGPRVRRWLDVAGEFEALAALAALAHDHPDWEFPEIDATQRALTAERVGHPMLDPATRVDNDVTVGPSGTFLLVTGSNMSGKSTLLRAIGLNTVLAFAGAPVCAHRFTLPPLILWTSIHVEDSLVRGVSFFMAQLYRMKAIVSAADAAAAGDRHILYLLDEILQGTNTAERRIAATRVIHHLVDRGAIGAVTTHDLELASESALASAANPVHFRETVHTQDGRPIMTFDYLLRPGIATSTNALKLMEIVGLKGPEV
ncbi:MAG: MutS-related protein, partial [Longimicrobiales bacterium]